MGLPRTRLFRRRAGFTLVEVLMACIIASMTTTAVFSVVLSGFVSDRKADKRDLATGVLRRARETLKSYVGVEATSGNMFPGVTPARPGSPNSGIWSADSSGGWALAAGNHDISSIVAGTPLDLTPMGGPAPTLTYRVTNVNCLGLPAVNDFNQCKSVTFTLTYGEDVY